MKKIHEIRKKMERIKKASKNWQTDSQGRRFLYIKPEEIPEYQRRGWRIEQGPRGGNRAYPPAGYGSEGTEEGGAQGTVIGFDNDSLFVISYGSGYIKPMDFKKVSSVIREMKKGVDYASKKAITLNLLMESLKNRDINMFLTELYVGAVKGYLDVDDVKVLLDSVGITEEEYKEWVDKNTVELNPELESRIGKYVDEYKVLKVDGRLFTLWPGVIGMFSLELEHETTMFLVEYVKSEGERSERLYDSVKRRLEKLLSSYRKIFKNEEDFERLKEYVSAIVRKADKAKEILRTKPSEPLDVSSIDFAQVYDKIEEFKESLRGLVPEGVEESIYRSDMYTLEDLIYPVLGRTYRYLGEDVGRIVGIYELFRNVFGFSDEEAKHLAKGWNTARYWNGWGYVYHESEIEKLIKQVRGNGRVVREVSEEYFYDEEEDDYVEIGSEWYWENYADPVTLESYRRFVSGLMREWFRRHGQEKMTLYRGLNASQTAVIIAEYFKNGEFKVFGVADSFSVDVEIAEYFASINNGIVVQFESDNWDSIVGSWYNAAPRWVFENEIVYEKPPEGLSVRPLEIADILEKLRMGRFEEVDAEKVRELKAKFENGVRKLKEHYGNLYEEYRDGIERAMEVFDEALRSVEKSFVIRKKLVSVKKKLEEVIKDAKYWQTDSQGRRFLYIKPEEIQEYQRRGWRIEYGPKGGIKAYPPAGYDVSREEERAEERAEERVSFSEETINLLGLDMELIDRIDFDKAELAIKDVVFEFRGDPKSVAIRSLEVLLESRRIDLFLSRLYALTVGGYINVEHFSKILEATGISVDEYKEWINQNSVKLKSDVPEGLVRSLIPEMYIFDVDGERYTLLPVLVDNLVMHFGTWFGEIVQNYIFSDSEERREKLIGELRKDLEKLLVEKLVSIVDDENALAKVKSVLDSIMRRVDLATEIMNFRPEKPLDVSNIDFSQVYDKIEGLRKFVFKISSVFEKPQLMGKILSFEGLVVKVLSRYDDIFGSIASRHLAMYELFRNVLGFDHETAMHLAKGWETARFWTGQDYKYYAGKIERLVQKYRGNGRPPRKVRESDDPWGELYFERFADPVTLESYRRFVRGLVKEWFRRHGMDRLVIYRGLNAAQTAMLIVNYIKEGKSVLTGVADSFSLAEEVARDFAKSNGGIVIKLETDNWDNIVGAWFNASPRYLHEEEVIYEKPPEGLEVEILDYKNVLDALREGRVEDVTVEEVDAVIELLQNGVDRLYKLYSDDVADRYVREIDNVIERLYELKRKIMGISVE